MKSSQTMIVTAMLLAAAFAGIVFAGEEIEADDSSFEVQYATGDSTFEKYTVTGDSFTVKTTDGVRYWTNGDDKYYPGQVVSIEGLTSPFILTPVSTVAETVYATLVIQDVSYIIPVVNSALDTDDDVYADAKAVCDDLNAAGYKLTWSESDPFTADAITENTTFTLTISVGTVIWVTGDTIIRTSVIEDGTTEIPEALARDYYTFKGWSSTENGDVEIIYNSVDGKYYLGTATEPVSTIQVSDVSGSGTVYYYAIYEASIYTITLMVDDEVYGTMMVSYGETVVTPALPDKYVYWAVLSYDGEDEVYTEFDFSTAIAEDVTLYAIAAEDVGIYTVTFMLDEDTLVSWSYSNNVTVPAVSKEGYDFIGWYIGNELIEDPAGYEFTSDTTFTAGFKLTVEEVVEPAFYETTMGQVVIVLVVFALLCLGYAIYTNMFGLKDKILRKKDTEE